MVRKLFITQWILEAHFYESLLFRFSKYGKGFYTKILLTGSPEISEYFFAGLNDGGATMLLSETKSVLEVEKHCPFYQA